MTDAYEGFSKKSGKEKVKDHTMQIRSGIPIYKALDSNKKSQMPRGKRPPSFEKMSRISLASNRNTPNLFVTPNANNKYLALPSTNSKRQSTDTVRSSFGGNSRKEVFPIGDSAFKTQCIDKLNEFLMERNFGQPYDRNMLKLPTGKEFASIFKFLYQFVDHNFKFPIRFEDDLPRLLPPLLKALKYPVQMSRSSFLNVGSPHSWPAVLAMLAWLIDVISFSECFDPKSVYFAKDFDEPIDLGEKKFNLLISEFLDHDPDQEEYQENYKNFIYETEGLMPNDFNLLQQEENRLIREVNNIPDRMSQVNIIKQQYNQLIEDKEKLERFIEDMKEHTSIKDNERVQNNMALEEKEGEARLVYDDVELLQKLKSQQNMNSSDLKKFKGHVTEIITAINHHQDEEKDLQEQVYASQMEISKNREMLRIAIRKYNPLCNHLQLDNCKIACTNFEGDCNILEEDILPLIKLEKRKVKELSFDLQNVVKTERIYKDKVEEEVQELEKDIFKLERKIKRLEEEANAVKVEIITEEQQLQEEYEILNDQVSQARRNTISSIYDLQRELDEIKKRFDFQTLRDQEERARGKEFIIQCSNYVKDFLQDIDKNNQQHEVDMLEAEAKHLEDILNILQN